MAFSQISGPIWRIVLNRRLAHGKETVERLPEKFGATDLARPEGRLYWFHALSVGESLALLPLFDLILAEDADVHILLTTSTATSAQAINRIGLPDRTIHRLLPIDTAKATCRFLDHWHPDIAIFAELDFWPRLMVEAHERSIPMVLINSRMSQKSFGSRRRLGAMMRDILGLFDRMLLQDPDSFHRFQALGADKKRISVVGALKAAARPLPADISDLAYAQDVIGARPVWLAAATRAIEDPVMLAAHKQILQTHPQALLILAPRHVRAGKEAEGIAAQSFEHVARRDIGQEIDSNTQVYIADTIGEMGLWYRLSPVSFIGHSLDLPEEQLGGKNPYEAAALGSAILHGPAVSDFSETYEALTQKQAARLVTSKDDLATAVIDLWNDETRHTQISAANSVIESRRKVLTTTWELIQKSLAKAT